jgi:lysophospholipase L1-like esterase
MKTSAIQAANNDKASSPLIVVGHSYIARLKDNKSLGNYKATLIGKRGALSTELMECAASAAAGEKTPTVIIHAGGNELRDLNPDEVADGILQVTRAVKRSNKNARIAISGIIPRPREGPYFARKAEITNTILRNKAAQFKMCYINNSKRFLQDGSPRYELFDEHGIHLSAEGEKILSKSFKAVHHFLGLKGH